MHQGSPVRRQVRCSFDPLTAIEILERAVSEKAHHTDSLLAGACAIQFDDRRSRFGSVQSTYSAPQKKRAVRGTFCFRT